MNKTNSVLYVDSETDSLNINNDSVFVPNCPESNANMAAGSSMSPSLSDVMSCLKNIEGKLCSMNKRLDALEEVKQKVDKFDTEIKKLWVTLEDKNRKVSDRVTVVEEKVENSDFALGMLNDKVITLERERDLLKQEVTYLQSQSMRNNLLFSNIPEAEKGVQEDTEKTVKEFLHNKMKVAKDAVDKMVLERVHRVGAKQDGRCRKIVAKFLEFKDREFVRKQWKSLEGTPFYISEQFPREVIEKRQKLVPKMKQARKDGKRAWIAYDTLYIDGKAVKD